MKNTFKTQSEAESFAKRKSEKGPDTMVVQRKNGGFEVHEAPFSALKEGEKSVSTHSKGAVAGPNKERAAAGKAPEAAKPAPKAGDFR